MEKFKMFLNRNVIWNTNVALAGNAKLNLVFVSCWLFLILNHFLLMEFIPIEKLDDEHNYIDVIVKTDNREIHVGFFTENIFHQYSKEGWSGKIISFLPLSNLL